MSKYNKLSDTTAETIKNYVDEIVKIYNNAKSINEEIACVEKLYVKIINNSIKKETFELGICNEEFICKIWRETVPCGIYCGEDLEEEKNLVISTWNNINSHIIIDNVV